MPGSERDGAHKMPSSQLRVDIDDIIRLNPGAWLETHGRIKNAQGKQERPKLNVLQRRINAYYMACSNAGRPCRGILVKPRKRGASTMVGAVHYSQLQMNPHEGLIIGDKLDTSDIVFRMMENYALSDEFLKQGKWGSPHTGLQELIEWRHGARLSQGTARGKATARGSTPQFIHGTEVAHWEAAAEALDAAMNAIPDDGFNVVILESTPYGADGPFAITWNNARWPTDEECYDGILYWKQWESLVPDSAADPLSKHDFVRIFAAWYEFDKSRIELTPQQKEEIRQTIDSESWYLGEQSLIDLYGNEGPMGLRLGNEVENCDVWEQLAWRRVTIKTKCRGSARIFDEEHPRDPRSCFLASGRQVFDEDALTHLQIQCRIAPEYGVLTERDGGAFWTRTAEQAANYWVWEPPMVGCRYLLIVDPAEGEDQTKGEDPDRHSVLVLRDEYMDPRRVIHKAKLVARLRPPNRMPMIPLSRMVRWLSLYYGRCCILPEMNNSGMALITALRMAPDCPPIWQRMEVDPHSGIERRWDGWRTTDSAEYKGLRATIIWHLHEALRNKALDCSCPHVHSELVDFVDKKGRMEAGNGHDDDVLSLSIGYYNLGSGTIMGRDVRPDFIPPEIQALMDEEAAHAGGIAQRW